MQTDFLAYLLELQKTGSLSKTAEHFYISYQSVQAGIRKLEQQFSVKLIACDRQGCRLTAAGELVASYAGMLFGEKEKLEQELQQYRIDRTDGERQILKVYVVPVLVTEPFLDFLKQYRKRYPEVELSMQIMSIEKTMLEVSPDEQTLILGVEDAWLGKESRLVFQEWLKHKNLQKIVLANPVFYMCVSKKSQWAHAGKITLEQYNKMPVYGNDLRMFIEEEPFRTRQIVNGYNEQVMMIQEGLGGAVYSAGECQLLFGHNKDIVQIPLDIEQLKNISYVCWVKNKKALPDWIRAFIDEIRTIF